MKTKLIRFWYQLHSSYWFLPTLMALAAIGLTVPMVTLDQAIESDTIEGYRWIYTGGPDGARAVLSTIAGSVIGVAGVTFSITIAALSLASQQFGPRLLRNFMSDRGNQVVLGTFIATYLYCLLILRTIRGVDDREFVPHVSITLGVVLATASLGVLIYFIHHVATSIQAAHIIDAVSRELDRAIDRLFPTRLGHGREDWGERIETRLPDDFDRTACPVASTHRGYIQSIDTDRLMKIAVQQNLLLRLKQRPGEFVTRDDELAWFWPGREDSRELQSQINDTYTVGPQRTVLQDAEFAVDQLVEVAVRALSPGVNDPFTAIMCVDQLSASLCILARRAMPSPYRYDEERKLRVIARPVRFADVADAAFHQIRQYGRCSAAVTIRLLEAIARIAEQVVREEDREALLRHATLIERGSREALPEEADRNDAQERYRIVVQRLSERTTN